MINVQGAVITSVKTMADRPIRATIDFGELVKLGEFEDLSKCLSESSLQ